MHGHDSPPLPVVLSPDPEPRAPGLGCPLRDEVLTIRRSVDLAPFLGRSAPSWEELLGSR